MDFNKDLSRISSKIRHELANNETISPLTTQSDNAFGIRRNKECQHRQQ